MEKFIDFLKAPNCVKQITDKDKIDFLFFRNRISLFFCCIALFVFVHRSDLCIWGLNPRYNAEFVFSVFFYTLLVGKVVNGFIADRVDSRKIGIIACLGEAICMILLLCLIPVLSMFDGSNSNISMSVYLLSVLYILIAWFHSSRYVTVIKTVALWSRKEERATVFALIALAAYIFYEFFNSAFSFIAQVNKSFILIPFIILNFAFAFLIYKKMVDSPNSIGLPDFEKYKHDGFIGTNKNIKQLSFWQELNKHIFCNSSFWYLAIIIILVDICKYGLDYFSHFNYIKHIHFYPLPVNIKIISLFVVLIAALISDKILKGKRLPVINCLTVLLLILLLYFQLSPAEFINANFVHIGWSILIECAVILLLYTGSVEIGVKKYAAARFGLYSLLLQLAANLNGFIMSFFKSDYSNAVWLYIIILIIVIFASGFLKQKHKNL